MASRTWRVTLVAGTVIAVGALISVSAATGAGGAGDDRAAARGVLSPSAKPRGEAIQRIEPLAAPRRACDAGCLKRKIKALTRRHNQLASAFNALAADYYNCEQLAPVTSYFGYLYDDGAGGSFPTSALDYTEEGDVPDDYMVVYVC